MKKEGVKSVLTKLIISLIILTIILISVSSISLSDTYVTGESLVSNPSAPNPSASNPSASNETVVFISSENVDKVEYVVYTDNNNGNEGDASSTSNFYATSAKTGTKESKESVDVVNIAPIYGKVIENFNAYSNKKNIDICSCGRFTDTLKVTNTGSTTTHYILKKGGSAANFVSYVPTELLLNPSETQSINMVGNVPCLGAVGSYTLQTYFETLAGSLKILTQQLNVKECDSFKAYPVYSSYKNAPCTPTSYNINIQNLKDIPDTFKLSLDNSANKAYYLGKADYFNKADNINKAYYKFTEPFVLLAPKEQKTTSLIINLPCEFSESYKFNVKVLSTITKKEQAFPLYLTIDKNGYSFGLDLGYPVKIENYTKKVSFAVKPTNLFSFCSNDVQLIPVKLTNLAEFSNSYKISLNSKSDDVFKTPASVALLPKQSALLNNYYYAAEEKLGNHSYTLQVVSEKGNLAGKLPITVEVKNCAKADNVGLEQSKPKKYTGLILLLFVFILIIILLLLFFMFLLKPKKTLFDELDQHLKEKESSEDKADEESDEEKIKLAVEKVKADLKKESEKKAKSTSESKTEAEEGIIDTFQDEESSSWWKPLLIFLVFIVGLLILYFIWPYLIGQSDNNALNQTSNLTSNLTANETLTAALSAETKPEPSSKESSEKSNVSFLDEKLKDKPSTEAEKPSTDAENLTEIEVAGIPDVSWWSKFLSWFSWLTPDKLSDVTILNETNASKEQLTAPLKDNKSSQELQPVVFDSKAFITQKEIDFTYRYWDEDTALTIDLSKYFVDIDNDELTFTNSKAPYVDVEYNGTTAYLIPHRDWFGESSIVFTASDGKGGTASTPEIVLVVRHAPEWFKWLKHYAWYAGVGAGLVILLIIILISYGIHTKRKPKKILLKKK
ncbi:hypothetical protein HY636_02905 [Candidatus Woesearchaeota archaeon]|nr:hypothetical protein [Candidatus Woesearchaeota archaeon]